MERAAKTATDCAGCMAELIRRISCLAHGGNRLSQAQERNCALRISRMEGENIANMRNLAISCFRSRKEDPFVFLIKR